jgi:hypothetical protein
MTMRTVFGWMAIALIATSAVAGIAVGAIATDRYVQTSRQAAAETTAEEALLLKAYWHADLNGKDAMAAVAESRDLLAHVKENQRMWAAWDAKALARIRAAAPSNR